MKKTVLALLLLSVVVTQVCNNAGQATTIDFSNPSKDGTPMKQLSCNQQTNIDFTFGQAASGTLNVTRIGSENRLQFGNSGNGDSKLQFLDVQGNNRSYALKYISYADSATNLLRVQPNNIPVTGGSITHQISFTYQHQHRDSNNNQVIEDTILVVYLLDSGSLAKNRNIIPANSNIPDGVQSFRTLVKQVANAINNNGGQIHQLSGSMAPFKSMDFGKFYSVQTQNGDCKTNYLISTFIYSIPSLVAISGVSSTYSTITNPRQDSKQAETGLLLCYGSHDSGLFQTHMRQSYPLWGAWFGALFFWVAILFAEPNTLLSLYDRKYQNNKWTSWEIYSLWHLAHQEFFSRMMRTTSLYVIYSICCMVCACLYGELGNTFTDAVTIIWMGVIGLFASFIFSFPLGIFINGQNYWTLQKFNVKRKIKALQDKQSMEAQSFQGEVDKCEDRIYSYYYWYYVFSICVIIVCWAISIHEMQKPPREHYYQMWYWVGAVAVAFFGHILVLSPIMTALFGDFSFYKYRGFWYDYELGQSFKQIQDN